MDRKSAVAPARFLSITACTSNGHGNADGPEVLTIEEVDDHNHDAESQHGDEDHVVGAAGA